MNKYTIPYFVENGRYQKNDFSRPCDGEGRYYHKGLYLSEDKYKTIKDSRAGPAMWGAPLMERSTNTTRYNGLDCSGFVSWARILWRKIISLYFIKLKSSAINILIALL